MVGACRDVPGSGTGNVDDAKLAVLSKPPKVLLAAVDQILGLGRARVQERCQSRHSGVVLGSGEEADRGVEAGWVGQHGLAVSSLYVGVVSAVCAAVGARAEEEPTVDSSDGQLSTEDGRTIPGVDGKLYYSDMKSVARRVLIHVAGGRRIPIEPDEVFLLEAVGDETDVRTRGARRLRDVRSLGEVVERFPAGAIVVVHRGFAVNVDRVSEIRRRANGRDWELKLEPPVNRIVPVARDRVRELWRAYGE